MAALETRKERCGSVVKIRVSGHDARPQRDYAMRGNEHLSWTVAMRGSFDAVGKAV